MKKLIFIGLLAMLTSCKAQKINTKQNKMKTFDIETFEKNENHLNEYTFVTKDSTIIEQDRWQFGFEEIIKPKNSYIYTYNKYYHKGNLKLTGEFFQNDFEKGVWKEYDEQGKLIKETDHDAPYKFTWKDILDFIKKRKLDMNAYGFRIIRGSSEKGTAWSITYNKSEEDMLFGVIIIDGITGEVIKEYDEPYPSEE